MQCKLGKPRLILAIVVSILVVFGAATANAVYDTPNNDADCPVNCRQIPWRAGSDQWNGGTLPTYSSVTCAGLTEGPGTTDNAPAIRACLNSLGNNQAALIPPGIYYINGSIRIPSNTALRGSGSTNCVQGTWLSLGNDGATLFHGDTGGGAACTTLRLGPSGALNIGTTESRGSEIGILNGYTKGSTSLSLASVSGLSVGGWISVFESGDSTIGTTNVGDDGACTWCGENNGTNLIQQFAQITSISGSVVTISRPLYYTYAPSQTPRVKAFTFSVQKAGIENIKLDGSFNDHAAFITLEGSLFCWVKNVETYMAGSSNATAPHVLVDWSHGAEFRDSYFHRGIDNSSGRNYGLAFYYWNSDHKIENNIMRHHRHSLAFSGGSGSVILYNYIDDNYSDDLTYLGTANISHGAHPMMNLYEGNRVSHLQADNVWGSSSHNTLFRNWLRGAESQIGVPSSPVWGFYGAELQTHQKYYSVVGNVLGVPSWSGGNGTVRNSGNCNVNSQAAYFYGCNANSVFDPATFNSILSHGNYDYITQGVAFWDGGSDHTLKNSMYYTSQPSFMQGCSWPVFGPDLSPLTGTLPAYQRFNGLACVSVGKPAAPRNLAMGAALSWNPVTTDVNGSTTNFTLNGYWVYQSTNSFFRSGAWISTQTATADSSVSKTNVAASTTSYALTSLTPGSTHYFRLSAYDVMGESSFNVDGGGADLQVSTFVAVQPPVITSAGTASGTVDTVFSYQITATNSPTSFNATGLPAWLSVNTASGLISGTPTMSGASGLMISATNSGGTGSATLAVTISSSTPPSTAPGLRAAIVYPNPVVPPYDPVIRICPGIADSIDVTIFDVAGRAVNSSTQFTGPTIPSAGQGSGQYCYEYTWTGHKSSGVYFAVLHAHGSGQEVKARVKFAVVR